MSRVFVGLCHYGSGKLGTPKWCYCKTPPSRQLHKYKCRNDWIRECWLSRHGENGSEMVTSACVSSNSISTNGLQLKDGWGETHGAACLLASEGGGAWGRNPARPLGAHRQPAPPPPLRHTDSGVRAGGGAKLLSSAPRGPARASQWKFVFLKDLHIWRCSRPPRRGPAPPGYKRGGAAVRSVSLSRWQRI